MLLVLLPAPNSTLSSRLDPFRSLVDPLFTSSFLLLTSTGAEQRCCWSCTGLPRHPPFDSSRERHLLPLLHLPQALVALLPGQTARNQRCTAGHHGCSAPSFGPRVDPLPPAVPGLIQAVVSTPIPSSTSPNSRPSFFPAGTELLASSRGGSNGCLGLTLFHPFSRAWSHQKGTP